MRRHCGYVKDGDTRDRNAGELLNRIHQATNETNEDRLMRNFHAIEGADG